MTALTISPEHVADVIVAGLVAGRRTVWAPPKTRWVRSVLRHLSRSVFRRMPVWGSSQPPDRLEVHRAHQAGRPDSPAPAIRSCRTTSSGSPAAPLSTFTEYFSTAMTNGMIEMTMQTGWAPTTVAVARSQRRRFAAPMCVRSRSCLPSLGVCLGCGRGCPGSGSRWTHQRAWTATKSRDEGWR